MIGEVHLKKLFKPEATTPFSKILCICALLSPWRHNGLDHRVSQISVCNHTSDNKIGRPRSGSPICLSRVWLQTELDNTKFYYQLIIKITISEKRRTAVMKERENMKPRLWLVDLNYNFECDRWIYTTISNVIALLNSPLTNCRTTNCPVIA